MERRNKVNNEIKLKIDSYKKEIFSSVKSKENIPIAYDGIVGEEYFNDDHKKILFLLKDTNGKNDYSDGNGYVCEDLYNTANATTETPQTKLGYMWRNICMFTKIIEDSDFDLEDCWNPQKGFEVDKMRGLLKSIAVVNVIKIVGKGSCPNEKIEKSVEGYYDLIKDEICIIKPKIVICGGVFEKIKNEYDVEIKQIYNGKRYFIYDDCIYLEYYHPGARFGYQKHFKLFKETYEGLPK